MKFDIAKEDKRNDLCYYSAILEYDNKAGEYDEETEKIKYI